MSPSASRSAAAESRTRASKTDASAPSRARGWASVYYAVKRIPRGKVSTYGAIAELAGMPRAARQVGWALNVLREEDDVPWHRVINSRGEISRRAERALGDLQRAMLEAEGVEFDARGRVSLARFLWTPRGGRRTQEVSSGERS